MATRACDAGADLLMDVQNSPIAAAVSKVSAARRRFAISTGSANPLSIATATATYLASQPGNTRWAMVAEDTGFGRSVAAIMSPVVAAHGAGVVTSVVVPASTADFSAALADVRGASPDVVAVFSAGAEGDDGVATPRRSRDAGLTNPGKTAQSDQAPRPRRCSATASAGQALRAPELYLVEIGIPALRQN